MRSATLLLRSPGLLLLVAALVTGCKKDAFIYDVDPVDLGRSDGDKDREKTNQEYAAILHANLFQTALSANDLYEIDQCIQSIGDKQLAREVIISNFMNKPGVMIPSDSLMHADVDAFIIDTYNRFLVRNPTEAEKTWFRNTIAADPNVTTELIYFSFALSEEYLFY
ncbi:MAG TPA: hypothetical protein PLB89_12395 [Flavobacteriales bacterium]|nr:hypothetical protein [Flavobacteriales bacterium]